MPEGHKPLWQFYNIHVYIPKWKTSENGKELYFINIKIHHYILIYTK